MDSLREAFRPYDEPYSWTAIIPASLVSGWALQLTKDWGYRPYSGAGLVIGLGLVLGFALIALVVDYGMYRVGVRKATRVGLWLSAMVEPYATLWFVLEEGAVIPVRSLISGAVGIVLAFGIGYFLSMVWDHRKRRRA